MAQQQAYYNNPQVVCQPFFSLFQKKSRFLPGHRAIDTGAFAPRMIARRKICKTIMLVVTDMISTQVQAFKVAAFGVVFDVFDQFRALGLAPVFLFNEKRAEPRAKIHTADKIVGDESRATDDLLAIKQQIPLGQGAFGVQAASHTVVIDGHAVRRRPMCLKIGYELLQPCGILP